MLSHLPHVCCTCCWCCDVSAVVRLARGASSIRFHGFDSNSTWRPRDRHSSFDFCSFCFWADVECVGHSSLLLSWVVCGCEAWSCVYNKYLSVCLSFIPCVLCILCVLYYTLLFGVDHSLLQPTPVCPVVRLLLTTYSGVDSSLQFVIWGHIIIIIMCISIFFVNHLELTFDCGIKCSIYLLCYYYYPQCTGWRSVPTSDVQD